MRILPLAFCQHNMDQIDHISSLTHAHEISKRACRLYIMIAEQLLQGKQLESMIQNFVIDEKEFAGISNLLNVERSEIKSSGYVVDTLKAALWCLLHSSTYRECVLLAVNLGDDTDTTAAVAGGLAGIIYGCEGEKGIPPEWIAKIARKDWIKDLCGLFERSICI